MSTFYTNLEAFEKLKPFAEKLEDISVEPHLFQKSRYSDTLARYYFRLAITSPTRELYDVYLKRAAAFNEDALDSEPKQLYKTLKNQIENWMIDNMGFDKARAASALFD